MIVAKILKWLESPVAAIAVVIAMVALIMTPYLFWGIQGAAQFWGSFFAAITGLVGAIGAVSINAHFERMRDERKSRVASLASVRMTLMELRDMIQSIEITLKHQLPERAAVPEILTTADKGFASVVNLAETYLLTPMTDRNLAELVLQSAAVAKPLLKFLQYRDSFARSVATARKYTAATNALDAPVLKWSYVFNAVDLMLSNATSCVAALESFEAAHVIEYA